MALVLPLLDWPIADQQMWRRLLQPGGPFDERGPLTNLRPISLNKLQRIYGRWLAWLAAVEPEALAAPPVSRATPERLQAWIASGPICRRPAASIWSSGRSGS